MTATQYVYVFRRQDGLYKIGRAQVVSRRLAQVRAQVGLPLELAYLGQNSDAGELEHRLHELFKERREHGEWFRLTDADVEHLSSITPNLVLDTGVKSVYDEAHVSAQTRPSRFIVQVNEWRLACGQTHRQFAARLGRPESEWSHLRAGRRLPSGPFVRAVFQHCGQRWQEQLLHAHIADVLEQITSHNEGVAK